MVAKVDELLNQPSKFNKALKSMIKEECKGRTDAQMESDALKKQIEHAERTTKVLEKDVNNLR